MEENEEVPPHAYAKIIGPGWQYYMVKPKVILGRGGNGVECDIQLTRENSVSRQHFSIRYAAEFQALEIENLSKNGILVNGHFKQRYSKPVMSKTQCEIVYGRFDKMRVTLLLPSPMKPIEKKKKSLSTHHHFHIKKMFSNSNIKNNVKIGRFIPLLQCIAFILSNSKSPVSIPYIISQLKGSPFLKNQLFHMVSDYKLKYSVQHVITQNLTQFQISTIHVNNSSNPNHNHHNINPNNSTNTGVIASSVPATSPGASSTINNPQRPTIIPKFSISESAKPSFEQFSQLLMSEYYATSSKANNKSNANNNNKSNTNPAPLAGP